MAINFANLTSRSHTRLWEHFNNLKNAVQGQLDYLHADTGWQTTGIVYGNGFTPYNGAGWLSIAYRKVGSTVFVSGAFAKASWDESLPVCNIPIRPNRRVRGEGCDILASGDLIPRSGTSAGVVFVSYPVTET